MLSHTSLGADRTTLLKLDRSLVRLKLDYGSIIYGSARKSYLQMLDPIHNQGLRLALGAFRIFPVASLFVEADELSLYTHREKKLSLQNAIRLAVNPSNPAHEVTFPPKYVDLYEQKPKTIKSFGIRVLPLLESANIKPQNIEITFCTKYSSLVFETTWDTFRFTLFHIYYKMISESYKVVLRIIKKFKLMGQRKAQKLVVLLYQTTIAINNIYLMLHQFPLLKQKQLI